MKTAKFVSVCTALLMGCMGYFCVSNEFAYGFSSTFGKKEGICGSWNNYCRGAPATPATPYRQPLPTPSPQEKKRSASGAANSKAVEYWKQGDYEKAIEYIKEALRINPNNTYAQDNLRKLEPWLLNQKGVYYCEQDDYSLAIRYFQEILEIYPNYQIARENLRKVKAASLDRQGWEYYQQGNHEKAIDYLNKALGIDPNAAYIKSNLNSVKANLAARRGNDYWYDQQNYQKAIEYYKKAVKYEPDNKIYAELLSEQETEYKNIQALKKAKTNVGNILNELSVSSGVNTPETPKSSSDSLHFINPDEPLFSKGAKTSAPVDLTFMDTTTPPVVHPEDIKGSGTEELSVDDKVDALYRRATNSFGSGDYEGAIKYYKKALKLKPDDRNIQLALGEALWTKDKKKGTIKENPKVEILLDALENGKGDLDSSIEYLIQHSEEYREESESKWKAGSKVLDILIRMKKEEKEHYVSDLDTAALIFKILEEVIAEPPDKVFPEKMTIPFQENPERS